MQINKIVLYNFNSYEGLNEFDFSSGDSSKNIILIGGKNGAGKTSLFTAIKIALYGPLAFGYIGMNPHYIAKIKECINSKAFQKDVVEAKIQITISLMVEREVKEYEITREWDYTRQKLEEKYYVREEGQLLDDQKLSYFRNYLQGLVPPDLFEFFLFDGEAVGNIFSTSSYNAYIKNAIYTLCGLDVFEIVRKYTVGYVGKATNEDEEKIHKRYQELLVKEESLTKERSKIEEQMDEYHRLLDDIEIQIIEIETAFKNAGGITEAERQSLDREYKNAERIKTEALTKIKLFVEDLMPFFIVKDFTGKIIESLEFEEKSQVYNSVMQKLDKEEIRAVLGEKSDVEEYAVNSLVEFLIGKFKPNGFEADMGPIHDLSKDDMRRVNAMITSLEDFDVKGMVQLINERKAAADRTMEINKILKGAMTDEDAARFSEQENKLLKRKDELTMKIQDAHTQMSGLVEKIEIIEQQREKMLQGIKENAQNRHVFELSFGLSRMMETMLENKVCSIREKLEALIVENLQHIYRKNNLITHVEIEKDFRFNLYQNARYSTVELGNLMRNLGKDMFSFEVGREGIQKLFEAYKVGSLNELQRVLLYSAENFEIELFKRIDLSRLSKGERQIFILSLYWAIIKISGQDIPFIIDTPYARIDAGHRKEISEKFFPNISKQVIILSTDEEINEEYYEIIKPYISKEFLLINDENQNRTTIEPYYFFRG